MLNADTLHDTQTCIDDKWVVARPVLVPFIDRIYDAIQVFKGKADAVSFYKQ